MFTEYKFAPEAISRAALAAIKALASERPGANPAAFAASTIAARLRAAPARYLEYGPYWWAVKVALLKLGEDFGPADDAIVRHEYGGQMEVYSALVAGEQFRDFYRSTFLAGARQFWLDDQAGESYLLSDPDMEARAVGAEGGGVRPGGAAPDA